MPVNLTPPKAEQLLPVKGVALGIAEAGIKKPGCKDLLVVVLAQGSKVAGVFTQNRFCAAPVRVAREHLHAKPAVRALLVNTGNANAGTGEEGIQHARQTCAALAKLLGCEAEAILRCHGGLPPSPLRSWWLRKRAHLVTRLARKQGCGFGHRPHRHLVLRDSRAGAWVIMH